MLLLAPAARRAGGGLTPAAAVQLINREKAVVIDVCEPDEYAAGHVVGARSIPLGELEARCPACVKNKATPLVLVCASGMRSGRAVAIARKLGYENAQSLAGGLRVLARRQPAGRARPEPWPHQETPPCPP
jgi:rhodanese-related sulfurtransferase